MAQIKLDWKSDFFENKIMILIISGYLKSQIEHFLAKKKSMDIAEGLMKYKGFALVK